MTPVALILALMLSAEPASRETVSLDGTWQYVKAESLESAVPAAGWAPVEVPGSIEGYNYEQAWYRRTFTVPESWKGKRVLLRFGGVKFDSRVFVNDAAAGGCFNGYDAFELDVTDFVRYGGKNDLRVGVHDWTGLFVGDRLSLPAKAEWSSLRRIPRDRVVAPIGGRFDLYGIWDSVDLVSAPPVRVGGCFIRPSTREGRVAVDVAVINTTASSFSGAVDASIYAHSEMGGPAVASSTAAVEIGAGATEGVALQLPGAALKLWWPNEPNLYVLELKVGDDTFRERFGYREFWCENGDFFLNGAKVHLLGRSWWPYEVPPTEEAITAKIKMLKENNVNFFRTHTQPWPRRWYELADELGLMMMPEAAVFTDDETYRIEDPQFWDHYAQHLSSMVRNLKNHPSVVMWSLENEFCGVRAKRSQTAEANLARMGALVRTLDGTRPIGFESDGDPGGVADVIGLHYPNEFPERRVWPNDAYWMDAPNASRKDKMFWPRPDFLWDRSKPLYIGEFLWAPDESAATSTLFFGDAAYTDSRVYHFKAKAEAWRMQILAYRHYGVSGFAPWGYDYIKPDGERRPVLEAQRDMFRPLAAFVREQDARFFAGETVSRTLEIFNDTFAPVSGRLAWSVAKQGEKLSSGEFALDLAAGDHREQVLEIVMPEVKERTPLALRVTIFKGDEEQFTEDWPFDVFPKNVLTAVKAPLFVCDPEGAITAALQRANVKFLPLQSVDSWQGDGILVIGNVADTATAGAATPVIAPVGKQYTELARKVRDGGRVLSLAQPSGSVSCLPVRLTTLSSSMAFAQAAGHPILDGLQPDDLRWWRGDCLVSRNEPARPACGGGRALVVTGCEQGLAHAPLIEMPDGDGLWLLCQLLVAEKLETEPVASLLLDSMLAYLDQWQARKTATAFAGTPELCDAFKKLGLEFDALDDWPGLTVENYKLLVLQPNGQMLSEHAGQLLSFVEAGGNLFIQRPSAADFDAIAKGLNLPITRKDFYGTVSRAETDHPLLKALLREDLHWIEERPGVSIAAPPRAKDMADATYAPAGGEGVIALTSPAALVGVPIGKGWVIVNSVKWDEAPGNELRARRFASSLLGALGGRFEIAVPVTVLEAETMQPNPGIGAFTRAQDHVVMGANGYIEQPVEVPEAGKYRLRLHAKGSAVDGVYSIVRVQLDGTELGTVECKSTSWSEFDLTADLPAGNHVLRFAFVNDARRANEDRNLWLDRIEVAPAI